jgi:GT2 family glycosyltransferase
MTPDSAAADGLIASVVIPHYDDLANLAVCLDLMRRQTVPSSRFEIIVADNNSRAGFEAVRAVCGPDIRVVSVPEQGAGPARNAGAAQARAPILGFIDSDCRPDSDWLERGIAALAEAPVVGGAVTCVAGDPANLSGAEAFELVFAFRNDRYVAEQGFSVTCNLFVRRPVFDAVGGFRNHVSEDLDWGRRAASLGFPTRYDPAVRVAHPARADWPALRRKWQRLTRESFRLMRERPFGRLAWQARSWAVLLSALPHAARVLRSSALRGTAARGRALAILFRLRAYRFVEAQRLFWRDATGRS